MINVKNNNVNNGQQYGNAAIIILRNIILQKSTNPKKYKNQLKLIKNS